MMHHNAQPNRLRASRLALRTLALACAILCAVAAIATALHQDAFALTTSTNAAAATARDHSRIGVLAHDTFVLTQNSVEQTLEAGESGDYQITVDCPQSAGVPEGAELKVEEITQESREYDVYLAQAAETLGVDPAYIRLFDITIMNGRTEIQSMDTVAVSIELTDAELSDEAVALHFTQDGPEVMDTTLDGATMDFETQSFSVYAIVDAPEPAAAD